MTALGRTISTDDRPAGFRAYLPTDEYGIKEGYSTIRFDGWVLFLFKTNRRVTQCLECHQTMEPGSAVYRRIPHYNGFICLTCATKDIFFQVHNGYTGFKVSIFGLLQVSDNPQFSFQQVADAIRPAGCRRTD